VLLTHGFVKPSPLRVVADSNSWSKRIVESILFQTVRCPVSSVIEMFRIMSTRHANIVWKENASSDVLISMDCVSSKEGFDFVSFSVVGKDIYSVVELVCKFFPFFEGGVRINFLYLIFLKVVDIYNISVLIRTTIACNEEGSKGILDCISLACAIFSSHRIKINLNGLSNFLVESHAGCYGVCLIVILIEEGRLNRANEKDWYNQRYFHEITDDKIFLQKCNTIKIK
jgi:hypothetical protein